MFKSFENFVKSAQEQVVSVISEPQEEEDVTAESTLGSLWEESEHVNSCRNCLDSFAMPFIKRKHHCRKCGGVFCDECCPKPEEIMSGKKKKGAIHQSSEIRACLGCRRGETPGEQIQYLIRNQIEIHQKKTEPKDEMTQTIKKIQKVANKVANNLGIQVSNLQPSIPLVLHRGKLYEIDKPHPKQKRVVKQPPVSGYFEFVNKHTTICCIKVLLPGGDKKFEIPRPSYFAVPPGECMSGEFDSSIGHLELILLHNNPFHIRKNQRLVYDTRAKGVLAGDISDCAKVELFQDVAYYIVQSRNKNILLKYKGGENIVPRNGNSISRIGLYNWWTGRRYGVGLIDYNTNTSSIELDFSCSAS